MMFNIFSDICCICLSSLEARRQESSLHWEDICKAKEYICTVCSLPLPILKLGYLVFLLLSYMSLLYVLNINPLSDIWCANIFSFSVACLSPLLCRIFLLNVVPLVYFWFCCWCFLVSYPRNHCQNWYHKDFPLSFLPRLYSFLLKSLIHCELMFVYGVGLGSNFILLHEAIQFSPHHLLKKPSFPIVSS